MMTPEQKTAIAAKLGVDLATLDSDRLIELCLLHRAQPKALESFPNTLAAEINRRFTAAEITRDDVPYSVLQHFANQFTGAAPLFQRLMQEMAASINRDIWFTDNAEAFKAALANEEAAAWLAGQPDILNKCLGNRLALGYIAQSVTAATAILTREEALALWKNAPALWDIWPQHREGMAVLVKSAELTQYIIDTPAALAAVVASDNAMQPLIASATARRVWVDSEVAMTAVAASQTAMTAVAASQTAMTAVAASQTAMTAVAASQTAMTAVASVTAALKTVLKTNDFRTALMASNTVFQAARAAAYQTVSASGSGWVKQRSQAHDHVNQLNPTVAAPLGFVFACLGYYNAPTGSGSIMTHPGGGEAARAASTRTPTTMASVDGISFNGATFTETGDGYAYAELWAPA
ncbi:hypothetical protein [Cardiobacterium valvarum]|uniref:Uncharacterized protein n=1 Tax=Cardiobacterium valvarum TaxID=194702 RepID=A0A381EC05_9GAMM|nr:hypothetical protein [Cardiobacterium valvarum]SUX24551.1 Uncharacterised protein [Cardiobacterium valvarum]